MNVHSTPEFNDWLAGLNPEAQAHVNDRLDRIREHNHFGDRKYLGDELFELRWKNGRRVYFAVAKSVDGSTALMLLGGGKNGQKQDIARARKILEREDD